MIFDAILAIWFMAGAPVLIRNQGLPATLPSSAMVPRRGRSSYGDGGT
jgi:hypothetical protein